MNLADFVPTGRTSLVKKGSVALQIQTEYAYRPYPRMTTTILNSGQVLHKIEKKLSKAIESNEERSIMENRMKKQHLEIISIIKKNGPVGSKSKPKNDDVKLPKKYEEAKPQQATPSDVLNQEVVDDFGDDLLEKIRGIDGVRYVYLLDHEGNFVNKICREQFQSSFKEIFKNIKELLQLFIEIPGEIMQREKGVYVIEENSLYFLSIGTYFYFVLIDFPDPNIKYEHIFKMMVSK